MSGEPGDILWLVMVAKSWDSFEVSGPFPVKMTAPGPDEPLWFIPVFATAAAAEAWSEGRYRIVPVQIPPESP